MPNLRPIAESVNASTPGPPNSITWGSQLSVTPFNSLDTIHLGLFVVWPEDSLFLQALEKGKQDAQESEKPVPINFENQNTFLVYPTGRRGGYRWHIAAGDQHLFFSLHSGTGETPNLFVEIGSLSCWSPGYYSTIQTIKKFLELVGGFVTTEKISRVDYASDFVGLDYLESDIDDKSRWVKRGKKFGKYGSGNDYNAMNIGRGQISLRIYDKKEEVKSSQTKRKFFYEIWGLSPDDNNTPVLRVEYQLRKKVLKELGVLCLDDIPQKSNGTWDYCTSQWFRLAEKPVNRTHQSEAETHPFWKIVQSIKWSGIDRVSRQKLPCHKSVKVLLDMMVGCGLGLAAINRQPKDSPKKIIEFISQTLNSELINRFDEDPDDCTRRYKIKYAETWGME